MLQKHNCATNYSVNKLDFFRFCCINVYYFVTGAYKNMIRPHCILIIMPYVRLATGNKRKSEQHISVPQNVRLI